MRNVRASRIMLGLVVAGLALMFVGATPAMAAEGDGAAAFDAGALGNGLWKVGIGVGSGLVIMGAGAGIARIGGSAVESMARQPEVAGQIFGPMILTAALIEGATFFALIVIWFANP
ncbi:MAG: ATP synthase F0 subunit C [Thermoanaerobaculia bacterium]|nr:ATP synthase F0 subunit C [Thermoanaerobaculia bacterium]